ncbi:MAG: hypothetical protein ACTSYD_13540 [Candidatus Heimdallarchaeaceae archaeon]
MLFITKIESINPTRTLYEITPSGVITLPHGQQETIIKLRRTDRKMLESDKIRIETNILTDNVLKIITPMPVLDLAIPSGFSPSIVYTEIQQFSLLEIAENGKLLIEPTPYILIKNLEITKPIVQEFLLTIC